MANIEFDRYRTKYTWHILETERYIFHIEPSNLPDRELMAVLKDADNRYHLITELLEIDKSNIKDREKLLKYNYWIHNSEIAVENGMPSEGPDRFYGMGSTGISGIDYLIYKDSWKKHIRHLLHEEVHLVWLSEVGEAPSILNEGIAIYTEDTLYDGRDTFADKLQIAWTGSVGKDRGLLKKLMDNRFFWSCYGTLPVYTIGAALTNFIIARFGIPALKEIFLNTHFLAENLAAIIENKLGMTIDRLETEIQNDLLSLTR